jgi:hypothetical protein
MASDLKKNRNEFEFWTDNDDNTDLDERNVNVIAYITS